MKAPALYRIGLTDKAGTGGITLTVAALDGDDAIKAARAAVPTHPILIQCQPIEGIILVAEGIQPGISEAGTKMLPGLIRAAAMVPLPFSEEYPTIGPLAIHGDPPESDA